MDKELTAPIGIEVPDDRLVEVEKAKMSGEPLVSVGTSGVQIGTTADVAKASQDAMDEGTSAEHNAPDYLVELIANEGDINELNLAKAEAHAEVSGEAIKKQKVENEKARKLLAEDGHAVSNRILERQRKEAEAYAEAIAEFVRERQKAEGAFSREVMKITQEEALSGKPLTEIGKRAAEIDAKPREKDVFVEKDSIIHGAKDFKEGVDGVEAPEKLPTKSGEKVTKVEQPSKVEAPKATKSESSKEE